MTRLPEHTLRLTVHAVRTHPRTVATVALLYLVVYLLAIQNITVARGRPAAGPVFQLVPEWPTRIFDQIAPLYFEAVAAVRPTGWLTLLISPLNMTMGLTLGVLVAANVALGIVVFKQARTCRTRSFSGLLGALPAFLTGFSCCVPTVALVLGAQFTIALIAVRSYLFPAAAVALVASLAWNARREQHLSSAEVVGPRPLPSGSRTKS